MNTAGSQGSSGIGTSAAATRASGNKQPSGYAPVENWDGSSWTAGTDLNTPRGEDPGANGIQTSALVYGGYTTPPATYRTSTEAWDGSSWTEVADLSTGRYALVGSGTTGSSSALAAGGYTGANSGSTEEWTILSSFQKLNLGQVYFNSDANAFKVTEQSVPGSVWASGGSLNTAKQAVFGYGPTGTAAGAVGGSPAPDRDWETLKAFASELK